MEREMESLTKDVKKLTVDITGMHCPNCEHLIERRISKIPGVVGVLASEQKRNAEIFYLGEIDFPVVQRTLQDEGYTASIPSGRDISQHQRNSARDYAQIAAAFAILIGLILLVQHLGLIPQGFSVSENTGYGLAFLIGLAASVTSCMAVTGGLLVALAAKYNEANPERSAWRRFKPHLAFNAGRLVSYALLGGAVGALGSALTLSPTVTSVLIVTASVVMILLGLQMLRLLPSFGSMALVPKNIGHRIHDLAERNSGSGAFTLGALTFFLPCGFTQALQLYVLAKGSFTVGALTMLAFALGTLPALLSLSALSSFVRGAFQSHFLRFAGAAVILLGFLNIQYGLVLAGSNFGPVATSQTQTIVQVASPVTGGKQVVEMKIDGYAYIPNRFTVRQGVPVEWRIDARDAAGCGRILLSRSLGIQKFLSDTEINVITFTPRMAGQYSFNCGMGMMTPNSHFTVTANSDAPQVEKL
jgi:sulfite exporter TauE/SafE/copper chaperone CopZ